MRPALFSSFARLRRGGHIARRPYLPISSTTQTIRSIFVGPSTNAILNRQQELKTWEEDPTRYTQGGYHPVRIGDIFNNKYQILQKLGYGLYSTVWLVQDTSLDKPRYAALKILTADSYGGEKSLYELKILKHLASSNLNHSGSKHVAQLLDDFIHQGPHGEHVCLIFELMGESMVALTRRYANKQLPLALVKQIAQQLLLGLDWLHKSGVIHTDIKPGNILIGIEDVDSAVQACVRSSNVDKTGSSYALSYPLDGGIISAESKINIKIIDFGVSSWVDDHLTELIQPPSLRAPEVIIGAPWDCSVDEWSAACVIYELLQGRVLFKGRAAKSGAWSAEEDHLAQMIELFGPLPTDLLQRGKHSSRYFDDNGKLRNIKQLYPSSFGKLLRFEGNPTLPEDEMPAFEGFLLGMLKYQPNDRMTAANAAIDNWLQ